MEKEEIAALATEIKKHTDTGIDNVKTELTEQVTKIETSVTALKTETDKIEAVKTEVIALAEKVNGLSEKGSEKIFTLKEAIKQAFTEKKEQILNVLKSKQGAVELQLKVVADITTGNATSPDGTPTQFGQQFAPASNVNLKQTIVDSLVTNFATQLAYYPYTESKAKDGDALQVAEGVAKPQIDFTIETRYSSPVKVAAWERLTDESWQDIVGLQSIAETYLRDRVDIKSEKLIIADALANATVFDGTTSGITGTVQSPTLIDVINAMITAIFTTHNFTDEMPYKASLALIHPIDFFTQIVAAKDEMGLPLYPTASLFNRVTIGGVTLIPYEDAQLAQGNVLVADMSKINVAQYLPYTVKIGMINDDFVKNQFVILGEKRFHKYTKTLDKVAFLKGVIATIKGNLQIAA